MAFCFQINLKRYLCVAFALLVTLWPTSEVKACASHSQTPCAREAIFFIPGTFNSAVPGSLNPDLRQLLTPYFSNTILETAQNAGYDIFVVSQLKPVASFEENGERALKEILRLYKSSYPKGGASITFVGHSAGGLCALYAATRLQQLPIKNIVLLSTPLKGSHLADTVFPTEISGAFDISLIDLPALREFKASLVQKFLSGIRINPSIKVFALAGHQPRATLPWQFIDARYLSLGLSLLDSIIGERSDGVVENSSSYGMGVKLASTGRSPVIIQARSDIDIPLDHVEQVVDYRLAALFSGSTNPNYVSVEQEKYIKQLIELIQ